ncbi:methyltransferase [uncultured Pseudoteredinibacter sp.]|uniref:methyltransferase n=1 Tax=uncultured Pseudoteredinibacter sp. TaxID=1641701 RepID=UPI00260AF27F|nr:methyltransferase [uncultured Pseudoteredinibacter sp.]
MSHDYQLYFSRLCQGLYEQKEFWQAQAFRKPSLSWQAENQALSSALLSLDEFGLAQLENDVASLGKFLSPYISGLDELIDIAGGIEICPAELPDLGKEMRFFPSHIPGRKWQQIRYFHQAAPAKAERLVDWCCGKGHLGRFLALTESCPVLGLEWDQSLVDAGNELANSLSAGELSIVPCDVLEAAAGGWLAAGDHVFALHACGDLHRRMLQLAEQQQLEAVSLVPCCYQKISADQHSFLSAAAEKAELTLRRRDLHTIVQETVTAPKAVQKKRVQLQQWRLGFDVLQRDLRGIDAYLSTPSLPQSSLQLGFEGFCRLLADKRQLQLPAEVDWKRYQTLGLKRFNDARRLDLARLVFRRPLELAVVLDQLLYLQENGFSVELLQFCPKHLSPRNLLINAWRD